MVFKGNFIRGDRTPITFIKKEKFFSIKSGGPGGAAPWSKNGNHFVPNTSETVASVPPVAAGVRGRREGERGNKDKK